MTTLAQNRAIHALKKQLQNFSDDDYRAVLKSLFKAASSRDLSERQADALIDHLKMLGGRGPAKTASGKYAPILRALWIAGYNLAIVRDKDDAAMITFIKRQTGLDHVRFLTDHADAKKAIEALKSWIVRESGVVWPVYPNAEDLRARKMAVIEAQILQIRKLDASALDKISSALGKILRSEKQP